MEKKLALPSTETTGVLEYAQKTFQSLTEHFKTAGAPAISHGDAYEKALTLENKSIELYAGALKDALLKEESAVVLLRAIIDQEKKHARLIASLLEFQRNPGEWLENAEWRHLEEF